MVQIASSVAPVASSAGQCPFTGHNQRKALPKDNNHLPQPAQEQESVKGEVWHLSAHADVRQILRASKTTTQAGFSAEVIKKQRKVLSVIFLDGEAHKQHRSDIAKLFTPQAAQEKYHSFMEEISDELISELKEKKRLDLAYASLHLSVSVAAQVVGLTNSDSKGLVKRFKPLLERPILEKLNPVQRFFNLLKNRLDILNFYYFDIRPAIKARRNATSEEDYDDVISYLLQKDYGNMDIAMECLLYGAAGMVTTREFIVMAAWHLLQNDEVRQRYLEAEKEERRTILQEILRLEPVVSRLYRRTTEEIILSSNQQVIPAGSLIELNLAAANADSAAVGEKALELCPERERAKGVQAPVMGFGHGVHRCPGAFIAIEESDVFLHKLLALPLTIEQEPQLGWNEFIASYELKGLELQLQPQV